MIEESPPDWATEEIPEENRPSLTQFQAPKDAAAIYDYSWADGSPAFKVARFDAVNGHDKKRFQQWSIGPGGWEPKQHIPAGKRPLYGEIKPWTKVLVVEGEKTARAARAIFNDTWSVITWAGGASAAKTADWGPLLDLETVIWPDNDEPGIKAAKDIHSILPRSTIIDLPLNLPPAWDWGDDVPDGWDILDLMALVEVAPSAPCIEERIDSITLTFDPINWEGVTIPARNWLVPDLIPFHVPTMLSGMGGLGKTLLGIQLAHAGAANRPWIGRPVKQVKVFGVFCEDDHDEMHRRLHDINVNTDTSFGDLENMRLMIRDGEMSSLMDFPSPYEAGTTSGFFDTLTKEIKAFGAQLIILDSLYNFFHGNENNRVQVTQFVYALRRMAKECDAALVFVAHPSKSGISTGDGYAGSTAWHDAVRSRLYLTEETPDGGEKRLVLNTMKANYAPRGGQTEVYYEAGMLWAKDEQVASDPVYKKSHVERVFINLLKTVATQGRYVSDSIQGNYAPRLFSRMPERKGYSLADFKGAMERLFADGKIVRGAIRTATRKTVEGIVLVETGPKLGVFSEID